MTTTALKITALIFMTIDHIGEFIPATPQILRILGRISAPIFIFCAVEGFCHTHNRKIYMARLYVMGIFMGAMDFVLNTFFPRGYVVCDNNIFSSIFLISLIIYIIEGGRENQAAAYANNFTLKNNIYNNAFLKISAIIMLFILPGIIRVRLVSALDRCTDLSVYNITDRILPGPDSCEGGIFVICMGLVFYSGRKGHRGLKYSAFCAVYFLLVLMSYPAARSISMWDWVVVYNFQCLQILALPFIYCYNGEKGRGLKYLFYVFYPLHIAVLYLLGGLIRA